MIPDLPVTLSTPPCSGGPGTIIEEVHLAPLARASFPGQGHGQGAESIPLQPSLYLPAVKRPRSGAIVEEMHAWRPPLPLPADSIPHQPPSAGDAPHLLILIRQFLVNITSCCLSAPSAPDSRILPSALPPLCLTQQMVEEGSGAIGSKRLREDYVVGPSAGGSSSSSCSPPAAAVASSSSTQQPSGATSVSDGGISSSANVGASSSSSSSRKQPHRSPILVPEAQSSVTLPTSYLHLSHPSDIHHMLLTLSPATQGWRHSLTSSTPTSPPSSPPPT